MNVFSKKILLTSLATALAGSAQIASATSSAQATIDWDNLTITYIDLSGGTNTPLFTWTSQDSNSSSSATSADPYDSTSHTKHAYDFTSNLDTTSSTYSAQSNSKNSAGLAASVASQDSSSVHTSGFNIASASASNSGNFTLTGNGLALITLGWSISGHADPSTTGYYVWNNYASSGINISGSYSINGSNTTTSSNSYDTASVDYYYGIRPDYNRDGVFRMAILGDGVNTAYGSLLANVSANSYSNVNYSAPIPTPVPAAVWMFGSGLLGLIGFARRQTKEA